MIDSITRIATNLKYDVHSKDEAKSKLKQYYTSVPGYAIDVVVDVVYIED